ncbi:MAG: response regulator [Acidobacteriia bacterium]|nr:response regulator [Terriglobia bacterium]
MDCERPTLLVVDDDSEMRETASMMLECAGYDVLTAGSGKAALRLCEEHSEIDLVLTDFDMPMMNGLELANRLSGLTRPIAIVLMTAHPVETLRTPDTHSSREFRILRKPFTSAELREEMAHALDLHAPAG